MIVEAEQEDRKERMALAGYDVSGDFGEGQMGVPEGTWEEQPSAAWMRSMQINANKRRN